MTITPKMKVRITSDRCGTQGEIKVTLWELQNNLEWTAEHNFWAVRDPYDQGNVSPCFYHAYELEPA